jgi:hypothetical protein
MQLLRMLIRYIISIFPIAPKKAINFHKIPIGIYLFIRNFIIYKRQNNSDNFNANIINSNPNLYDRFEKGGNIPKHYFHQDLWMAQKVYYNNPSNHYDIGSRLDGFISHCLVFTDVTMLDIRDINHKIQNLSFIRANAMNMENIESNSISSISSLHVVEHFGLGRYGDPINPNGYKHVIKEIQRVASKDIYISVPIGAQRLIFDSHRIFNPVNIIQLFNQCILDSFAAIDDNDSLRLDLDPTECQNFDYGCGLYHFKKSEI